jgi:Domain of unknown function (DUF6268)
MKTQHLLVSTIVFVSLSAGTSLAQTGPQLLLEPLPKDQNYEFNSEFDWFADSDLDRAPNDLGMRVYSATGRARFDLGQITQGIQKAQPRVGFDFFHMDLRNDGQILPGQFTDASVGASIGILAQDKWVAGIALGVGYASANVFNDGNAIYYKADLAVGYTIDDRQTIGFVLNYDGNRSIFPDVPLPGFQYTNRHSDELTFSIGFPFTSLTYKPDGKWTFEFAYAIPDSFTGKIDYAVSKEFGAFVAVTDKNMAFHWNELSDGDDRIFFSQTKAELGVRGTVNESINFVVAGGYAFRQKFEVGFDTRDSDTVTKVDAAPYGRVGFEMKF